MIPLERDIRIGTELSLTISSVESRYSISSYSTNEIDALFALQRLNFSPCYIGCLDVI